MQGYGFAENTGDDWPIPEQYCQPLTIIDSNNQRRLILMDRSDQKLYWMDTRDGPPGSNMDKIWQDKADTAGANGTEIAPSVKLGEVRGEREKYFVEHLVSRLSVRPVNAGESLPSGAQVDFNLYKDGEQTTESAGADDIDEDGEIVVDRRVRGHRIQPEIVFNRAEMQLLEYDGDFLVSAETSNPATYKPTAATYQSALMALTKWMSRGSNLLLERVGGSTLAGAGTATTGPDGKSYSALTISTKVELANSIIADGTLLIWHKTGYTIPGVSLTQHSTSGTWILSYANGALPASIELGVGDVFDVRLYSSQIDSDSRGYYFTDVVNDAGRNVMDPW